MCIRDRLYALRRSVAPSEQAPENLDTWLRDYIAFAERILVVADKIVLVPFGQLTTDYERVINYVNREFGTEFVPFEHNDQSVADVFSTSGSHLSPSEARQDDKATGVELYERSSPELRERAEHSHAALLAHVSEDLRGEDVTG